jgi:hypothetical protein
MDMTLETALELGYRAGFIKACSRPAPVSQDVDSSAFAADMCQFVALHTPIFSQPAQPTGPATRPEKTKTGVFNKFNVSRVDGTDCDGGKHESCSYFVLDIEHDKFAKAALRAYADACQPELPILAADMRTIYGLTTTQPSMPASGEFGAFQARVSQWMGQCFLPSLYSNMTERGDRLLEEVLELLQSKGYDRARVATLVDYVWGRPVGEPAQEVGGVMVTLAGFCWIAGLSMHEAGEQELARITQPEVMEKIRRKQQAKNALHFDTPLPGHAHPTEPVKVPNGYALVPKSFLIEKDTWEAAQFAFGGPGTGDGEEFMDCTAWIGDIDNDDGSKTHGIHISCNECPEEGSITIAEFAAAPEHEAKESGNG